MKMSNEIWNEIYTFLHTCELWADLCDIFFFLKKKIGKKEKSCPIYLVVVPNPILKNACVV